MKTGARNELIGKVVEVKKGNLMALVKVTVPAEAKMASVMTIESLEDLGIKEGDRVEVVVKAVNVLLIKD
jgi:molybdopterin-binding protein